MSIDRPDLISHYPIIALFGLFLLLLLYTFGIAAWNQESRHHIQIITKKVFSLQSNSRVIRINNRVIRIMQKSAACSFY